MVWLMKNISSILYYITLIFILYYIILYYIGVGGDPRPISSLGALDGGSDRDKFVSVVCLSVVCLSVVCLSVPPPRPTRDPPQQMGRSMDRSKIDPGSIQDFIRFYTILFIYTKINKIHILGKMFAPARNTDRRK